jgi:uncharacterized caspase-like protein
MDGARNRVILHSMVWILFLLAFQSCTAMPVEIKDINIETPSEMHLPVKGQLIVDITPEERSKTYTVKHIINDYVLREGELIHSAALKVFGRLFTDVYSADDKSEGHLVVRVSGHGYVNTFWGTYHAEATAHIEKGDGSNIGRFTAHGSGLSGMVNDSVAFENAYVEAFKKIADELVRNANFVSYVKKGLGETDSFKSVAIQHDQGKGSTPATQEATQQFLPQLPPQPETSFPSGSGTPAGQLSTSGESASSKRWAVIIGVSDYQDTRIPSLRYASTDAQAFYDWIVSPTGGKYAPARVRFLIDHEATLAHIKEALFVWLRQAIEEDVVTIYFAGHGSPESPDSPENLFLLPYDVEYNALATSGFPMWDIETALQRFVKAKKVIVIADACHTGGVGQPFAVARRAQRDLLVNPISTGFQNLAKVGDGVAVLSASDTDQFSQEDKKWGGGHGVFTYFLVKGLSGEADYNADGRVTLGEIIPYLSESVRRETHSAQSPTVAGRFDPAMSIGK